ncbi:MAG TPA: bifunctional UDP-N-acetylglucosamine diphosphorylase/glucosamine-1-phosphate N-acetyltransferase GlmU [Pseudolysinimonas sp.]|nr:bifunctional UDP-N-acetylglucosamine diphosphorylase/glucosamine-1-phosphate N-acetyltransferase GlmU [Pseudolysinimonas sp.]
MTDPRLAVIVLAAGQGTRMKSSRAKVLHPLAGVPLIGHVLATARELSADHVIVVVRHQRDAVAEAIVELMPEAVIVDQDETPGTGRAVELGLGALPGGFEGEVVVVSGDVPLLDARTLASLVETHRGGAASATVLSAMVGDATGYGRIVRDASGAVLRIVEQKDATPDELTILEINSGTYVFAASALRSELPRVTTGNAQGEKYLTDVIGLLRTAGQVIDAVPAPEAWMVEGVNDRVQLAATAARLNAMIVRGWQVAGVTVQDPATTWIDIRSSLAEDVELLPGTHIAGATSVARGARIGPQTTLVDCEVGENATISRSDATLAVIAAGASVGPFAYLRPGTELGENGKIGTFVETKNAKIAAGSKVPHLSYMGDVTIGEGTNIGAGGVTANYDDIAKHATTIGAHVHTGVHNVFVAPVTIGDGAKVGAGAVIRKDVPPGALAISVAPQRNVEGWTEKNRAGTASADAASKAATEGTD